MGLWGCASSCRWREAGAEDWGRRAGGEVGGGDAGRAAAGADAGGGGWT
jgi:hypothetical protein